MRRRTLADDVADGEADRDPADDADEPEPASQSENVPATAATIADPQQHERGRRR